MNRSDFPKSLGLGAGGLILSANSFIQAMPVKIYDNHVRGLSHYHFKDLKGVIKEGGEIQLVREPENHYDSFAAQVNFGVYKIGYIAAYENIVLANMIDAGVKLIAYVSQKDLKRYINDQLAVEVFAELIVPSQKLIDSMLAENRADNAADIYRQGDF